MLSVPRDRAWRRLFLAQSIALVGTGLATVALGLLAHDLAGDRAGTVLGTALAIKMVAYVGLAPLIAALTHRMAPRALLVAADLVRAVVAMALPLVTEVWQVYALIFVLQSASAAFAPAFQSLLPRLLPAEEDYTRALSLSRLSYDLEMVLSPALAAVLLTRIDHPTLFLGTVAGFLVSAVLVLRTRVPQAGPRPEARAAGFGDRATRGIRLFLATPRLRALLPLTLAVAAGGSTVLVNTVVHVRDDLGRAARDVPLALGAYGAGSMTAALLLPRLSRRVADRTLMLPAAFASALLLTALAAATRLGPGSWSWPVLLATWAALGLAESAVVTPTGRLIRRSARTADLTSAFAAHFSLSHGCWLLTYPLAGWLGATAGLDGAALVLGAVALAAALAARRLWPAGDPARLAHVHTALGDGHPHLAGARRTGAGWRHTHHFVIDDLHDRWPLRPAGRGRPVRVPRRSGRPTMGA
ncbi:MFS transporter [Streptomyces pactum]|uniref:MFS transporter n=1 Tax=Streptomyces pactum TaxID=68249 RepID=A0ABS0NTR1_9ACTN|nr:MFS transporter [Streptomyces pactum]MBH5338586.1 MFS transporter [Streptomyces pactum]